MDRFVFIYVSTKPAYTTGTHFSRGERCGNDNLGNCKAGGVRSGRGTNDPGIQEVWPFFAASGGVGGMTMDEADFVSSS